jgi:chromosomal replication initiator protein
MYIARQLTRDSFADIGRAFGGKDHTTVLHGVHKIETLLQEDPNFRKTIDRIIQAIRLE